MKAGPFSADYSDMVVVAVLIGGAVLLAKNMVPAAASAAVNAAAEAARAIGGNSGAVVFDALHYTSPTADMFNAFPSAYRADYYGNIFDEAGSLIGYETDDYWIRDAGGNRLWQSSWSGTRFGLVFHLPSFAGIVAGSGASGSW